MQNIFAIWLSLLACLVVIGVAGVKLSRYGDIIANAPSHLGDLGSVGHHQLMDSAIYGMPF